MTHYEELSPAGCQEATVEEGNVPCMGPGAAGDGTVLSKRET